MHFHLWQQSFAHSNNLQESKQRSQGATGQCLLEYYKQEFHFWENEIKIPVFLPQSITT